MVSIETCRQYTKRMVNCFEYWRFIKQRIVFKPNIFKTNPYRLPIRKPGMNENLFLFGYWYLKRNPTNNSYARSLHSLELQREGLVSNLAKNYNHASLKLRPPVNNYIGQA